MAITAVFETGMTQQQYDQVVQGLEAAGLGTVEARIFHVASLSNGKVLVVDVWESEQTLGAFAEKLMPIIAATGVTPPEPVITPVHNIIS